MKILILKTELHNGVQHVSLLNLKDNLMSSIYYNTYRGHIRRLRFITSHFQFVATHTKGTLKGEC